MQNSQIQWRKWDFENMFSEQWFGLFCTDQQKYNFLTKLDMYVENMYMFIIKKVHNFLICFIIFSKKKNIWAGACELGFQSGFLQHAYLLRTQLMCHVHTTTHNLCVCSHYNLYKTYMCSLHHDKITSGQQINMPTPLSLSPARHNITFHARSHPWFSHHTSLWTHTVIHSFCKEIGTSSERQYNSHPISPKSNSTELCRAWYVHFISSFIQLILSY